MIGWPMLPGVPGMATQGYDMMQGQHPGYPQPQDPSTWDYFLRGWDDAGGLQSLPGMLQDTFMDQYGPMLSPPQFDPRFQAMNQYQDGGASSLLDLVNLSNMANNPEAY
tara:strand:+ start:132 stop:458 length:327 start_codon:yes stop_codon:yes gene_type:complete